jgi:hypothetical protein
LASIGQDVIEAIAREIPAYARPLEGSFGRGVRAGVDEALTRFLAVVDAGSAGPPDLAAGRGVYVQLGRGEYRAGRSLDNLLSAYRVGARVSWRRLGEAAQRAGMDAAGLVALAETVFAYIDGISGASAEGYALEQFAAAGERQRLVDRLGKLLLSGAPADAVAQAARAASVRLPEAVAAVLVPNPPDDRAGLALPPEAPRTADDGDVWAFVGDVDGPGRRAALARRLAGLRAVVGPALPWAQAAAGAGRVRAARAARDDGRLPAAAAGADPLFTDDHLCALLLARDPALLADLARRRLAPLAGLPARTRVRLAETLLHWLALHGQRGLVAARLHIHPQTVRYRVAQLRELFGAALDDPDARFELELVLRAAPTPADAAAGWD